MKLGGAAMPFTKFFKGALLQLACFLTEISQGASSPQTPDRIGFRGFSYFIAYLLFIISRCIGDSLNRTGQGRTGQDREPDGGHDREQGTVDRGQGTGDRGKGTGNCGQDRTIYRQYEQDRT